MSYENIKFVSFNDFYKNRKIIRYYYRELSISEKWLYKRYVYDEVKESESDKNVIWNFLNENESCKKELKDRIHTRKMRELKKLKKDIIIKMLDLIED